MFRIVGNLNILAHRDLSKIHLPYYLNFFLRFVGLFHLYLIGQLGEKVERQGEDMQEIITGQIQTLDLCVKA